MSRDYCEDEFILDTKHLLNTIDELNSANTWENQNINLFTLDVEKLYPSIQPQYVEEALQDLLSNINEEDANTAKAVETFVKLSLQESYITYKDACSNQR